jgi:hypothetical protein
MPILDNLSVISESQQWSISYHSHYGAFVLNVSVLITPPVPQSSKRSKRLRYRNIQIKRTRCAYMIILFALWISLKWVKRKTERSGAQIPDGARDFPFPRTVQTRSGTHPVFYSTSEEVVSRVQRQDQGKEWVEFLSYILHGVARANFAFTQFINISDPKIPDEILIWKWNKLLKFPKSSSPSSYVASSWHTFELKLVT